WAVRVKNVVRPRGLRRLGLPCLLTGSGMAFPWRLLRDAPLATGHIVEDMRLGIDLAIAGHPPLFEPDAAVGGELPAARGAARSQRTRWEHGHLGTLVRQVPRLIFEAVRQRRADLAGLALELGVPPLSVLGLLWLAVMVAALTLADSWLPAGLLLTAAAAAAVAGLAAWAAFGRAVLPPAALLAVPGYALGKLPIYLAYLVRPQRAWVRTPRDVPPAGPPGEVAQ
ncbi:MAG TPA: glycosyltransferase family 2 protein, partial [Gemmataceae bacterium]